MGYYVYIPVGSGEQLLALAMDPDSGELTPIQEVDMGKSGHAACADPQNKNLYVGLGRGDQCSIASFAIDPQSGALTPLGEVAVEGMVCYLAPDRGGRFIMAAYYSDGMVTVHRVGAGGALEEAVACRYETERCAHFIATDASNRWAFVPHVAAANSIYQFSFDAATGTLTSNPAQPVLAAGAGEGPRHLAFHPHLDRVYADNEQGSSLTVYRFDRQQGTLVAEQTVSTLPEGGHEGNSNAQVHIHPSGKSIYVSNRGHDSIAAFAIDPASGLVRSLGQEPAGAVPRAFAIDPQGRFLFSGADQSQQLLTFAIAADGRLEAAGQPYELGGTTGWVCPLKVD